MTRGRPKIRPASWPVVGIKLEGKTLLYIEAIGQALHEAGLKRLKPSQVARLCIRDFRARCSQPVFAERYRKALREGTIRP